MRLAHCPPPPSVECQLSYSLSSLTRQYSPPARGLPPDLAIPPNPRTMTPTLKRRQMSDPATPRKKHKSEDLLLPHSSILQLPNELLARVLCEVIDCTEYVNCIQDALISLANVCSRFRDIIEGTPDFWRNGLYTTADLLPELKAPHLTKAYVIIHGKYDPAALIKAMTT